MDCPQVNQHHPDLSRWRDLPAWLQYRTVWVSLAVAGIIVLSANPLPGQNAARTIRPAARLAQRPESVAPVPETNDVPSPARKSLLSWPAVANPFQPSTNKSSGSLTGSLGQGILPTFAPAQSAAHQQEPAPVAADLGRAIHEQPEHLNLHFTRDLLVFAPRETLKFSVAPQKVEVVPNRPLVCQVAVCRKTDRAVMWRGEHSAMAASDGTLTPPAPFQVPLPSSEGIFEVVVSFDKHPADRKQLVDGWGYRRRFDVVVVAKNSPPPSSHAAWELLQEIDLIRPTGNVSGWEMLTQVPFLEEFARNKSTPTDASAGVGHGIVRPRSLANRRGTELAGGSWRAVPMSVRPVGSPHIVEIDYPSDQAASIALAVIEPNQPCNSCITFDRGLEVATSAASGNTTNWKTHRFVFWPRTSTPWLVVANRNPVRPTTVGTIRLYGGEKASFKTDATASAASDRIVGVQLERLSLLDALTGAGFTHQTEPEIDWQTWWNAGSHATQYLQQAGLNALSIPVLQNGKALYPSQYVTHFESDSQNNTTAKTAAPPVKDIVALWLRICERDQVRLMLQLSLDAPLPQLEARIAQHEAGILLTDAEPGDELGPRYNPLHTAVQQALQEVVAEVAHRYGNYPACAGISLQLTPANYATLTGPTSGADEYTLQQFVQDEPQATARLSEQNSPAAMLEWLHRDEATQVAFGRWRARKLTRFYGELAQQLAAAQPTVRLNLLPLDAYAAPASDPQSLAGLDLEMANQFPQLQIVRTQSITPAIGRQELSPFAGPSSVAKDVSGTSNSTTRRRQLAADATSALIYLQAREFKLTDARLASAGVKTPELVVTGPLPRNNEECRRIWLQRVAEQDVQAMWLGGVLPPFGCEESIRELVQVWRRLPAVRFEAWRNDDNAQPVVLRAARHQGQLYFYLVNESAQPQTATLFFGNCNQVPLEAWTAAKVPAAVRDGDRWRWTIQLRPQDVIAVAVPHPTCQILELKCDYDPASIAQLWHQLHSLQHLTNALPAEDSNSPAASVDGREKPTSEKHRLQALWVQAEQHLTQGRIAQARQLVNGADAQNLLSQRKSSFPTPTLPSTTTTWNRPQPTPQPPLPTWQRPASEIEEERSDQWTAENEPITPIVVPASKPVNDRNIIGTADESAAKTVASVPPNNPDKVVAKDTEPGAADAKPGETTPVATIGVPKEEAENKEQAVAPTTTAHKFERLPPAPPKIRR